MIFVLDKLQTVWTFILWSKMHVLDLLFLAQQYVSLFYNEARVARKICVTRDKYVFFSQHTVFQAAHLRAHIFAFSFYTSPPLWSQAWKLFLTVCNKNIYDFFSLYWDNAVAKFLDPHWWLSTVAQYVAPLIASQLQIHVLIKKLFLCLPCCVDVFFNKVFVIS